MEAWWISAAVVSALVVTLVTVTLIGEGIREAFDPGAIRCMNKPVVKQLETILDRRLRPKKPGRKKNR
jgi:hypothetical protein